MVAQHIFATHSAHVLRASGLMEVFAVVVWVCEHDDMFSAVVVVEDCCRLHLLVEDLGETGWDWHVWDRAGRVQQRYGLADTVDAAKAQAEAALGTLVREASSPAIL